MSKVRSSYVRALLIMLAIGSISIGALAQGDFSTPEVQPAAPIHFTSPVITQAGSTPMLSLITPDLAAANPTSMDEQIAQNAPPPKAAPPPPQVRQTTQRIQYEARRWHVGGRIGIGFDPEIFMFGLQSQIGPFFNPRLIFRPNVDFGFGELTDMFALNLEAAYRFRTMLPGHWTPYFGAGPSLNFVHRGASSGDTSFSDFSYKTGFNVFLGTQKDKTFVEMKTTLWSGGTPVLRLFVGYNF